MDARISFLGGDAAQEASELADWLRRDRSLRVPVTIASRDAEPRGLGGVVEVVVAAVGSGGVGVALINALKAWLATRARQVTIEIETSKGHLKIKTGTSPSDEVWKTLRDILRDSND